MAQQPINIALDLDDTMYEYRFAHETAKKVAHNEVCSRYALNPNDFDMIYETAREEVKQRLGQSASSHSRLLYYKTSLEALGLGNHLDFAARLEGIYWGNFLRAMSPAPYLIDFLELCRERSIKVFVFTDLTASIQIRKLLRLEVMDHISGMISSEDVGHDKPHKGFFYYAEKHLEAKAGHWWVIGDDNSKDRPLVDLNPNSQFFNVGGALSASPNFKSLTEALKSIKP